MRGRIKELVLNLIYAPYAIFTLGICGFVLCVSFVVVLKKDECMLRYTTPCALVDAIATQPACKAN